MNITQIATAVTATITPFAPYLIEMGKITTEQFTKKFLEKGSDLAWGKAINLWEHIKSHLNNDAEMDSAITMVAMKPEDKVRHKLLSEILSARLEKNPELLREINELLENEQSIQQIIASQNSSIDDVTQSLVGKGEQIVKSTGASSIKGIKQSKC